ncbi:MAG: hypothetical protein EZS28_047571 [Streblomastix strix]|uniref:Uncharacterized protein n=1 Tax=Streblomastix strix TaxID=222440 RepID=A0A5J4TG90_9EUKA|nr:MAG: hypothetical protein EZS28_047571 [Streblomastix strix]
MVLNVFKLLGFAVMTLLTPLHDLITRSVDIVLMYLNKLLLLYGNVVDDYDDDDDDDDDVDDDDCYINGKEAYDDNYYCCYNV